MHNRASRAAITLSAFFIVAACGRTKSAVSAPDSAASNSASSQIRSISPSPMTVTSKLPCRATGLWALCSVERRIKNAGLVARKIEGDSPKRAGFGVKPVVYAVGRDSRLEVFIYPDEAALARDIARMDTVKVAPLGGPGSWSSPPMLIRSANLAAVLLTRDAREADRLSLALTAGAPQPAR